MSNDAIFYAETTRLFWTNNSLTYGIYRLLTRLIFALTLPFILPYSAITGRHRWGLRQRLGFYADIRPHKTGNPLVWIHGASVGEVIAAKILAVKIKKEFPDTALVLSTVTEQGMKVARKSFGDMATCVFAPLDFPGAVARATGTIRPDIYICLETELWPNLLVRLQEGNTRLFLLNGRLSERSSRRYRLLRNFTRKILSGFDAIVAITDGDAARFIALGADKDKIMVAGNVKYDLPETVSSAASRCNWRQQLVVDENQPILVAGSTHSGEEQMMLEVFRSLENTLPGLILIIAPRHLTRLKEIRDALARTQADHDLLSTIKGGGRKTNIIIVDTIGELAEIYSAADFIFCGGSLVHRGGHNIMEAAIWGVPVFYGPNMKDFTDALQLLEGNGGIMINNHWELAEKIKEHFLQPHLYSRVAKAAHLTARSQQGATTRQLKPVFDAIRSMCSNELADNCPDKRSQTDRKQP
jgi:3-deoxy-D-manno-octulosonic-acid transferase